MTQIAQLSEAEIEERFHVSGLRPVAFMLAGFAKERAGFSVQFGNGQMFLTNLLAVEADAGRLIFDCSGSADVNRQLLGADRCIFVGRPGGIHVQFLAGAVSEVRYEGDKAFSVALPKYIVRLQRRESFRIDTPRIRPLEFFGRLPNGGLLKLPAHDISVQGIGLVATELPEGLEIGQALESCHFHLPEDKLELFFRATINHITPFESRGGATQWRIGLSFVGLNPGEENRIQRYITQVERERHELS